MKPKESSLQSFIFYPILFLAASQNSTAIPAEESTKREPENVAVSHILDGKKFIGPTGEKGQKIHSVC
jgi:hypothetical protein